MSGRGQHAGILLAGMLALAAPAAAVQVDIPANLQAAPGGDVVVPVRVSPALGVVSIELSFAYDPAIVAPIGAFRTAATDAFVLDSDFAVPGTVGLSLSSVVPLSGSGTQEVAWLRFAVVGEGGHSDLAWLGAVLNAGALPVTTADGRVTIDPAASVVAVPDDALGPPGTHVQLAVSTNDATGAESFDIVVRYNPQVAQALAVQKTPLTQSMVLTTFLGIAGEVRISLFGTQPLAGGGPLVRIEFDLLGDLGEASPLDVSKDQINEGVIPSAPDDGLLAICSLLDGDGDGFTGCAGDCDDADPDSHPGATEVCDGLDNDCDGVLENDVPPPAGTPTLAVAKDGDAASLSWVPVPGATGYDVVRGEVGALHAAEGEFSLAVDACLGEDVGGAGVEDADEPAPGEAYFYLLRSVNCGGAASYDSGGDAQASTRDPGIAASPSACAE